MALSINLNRLDAQPLYSPGNCVSAPRQLRIVVARSRGRRVRIPQIGWLCETTSMVALVIRKSIVLVEGWVFCAKSVCWSCCW
jgi:hypothetical protein